MIIDVIGGGLAGSEAAYYLLKRGYHVRLFEARPSYQDKAHETSLYGELVCSNSLKGKSIENACGLLKEELKVFDSLMMEAASVSEVPSGNALGVDRLKFAQYVTEKLKSFPNLEEISEEVTSFSEHPTILATGPLTSNKLIASLEDLVGSNSLYFYDASAPIVTKDSLDFSICYFKSRYEQSDSAYINCPFDLKEDYLNFVSELVKAKRVQDHAGDASYFEGCLPIEVMAARGEQTLRFGPLKARGLEQEGKRRPYAVVQLRQDDSVGSLYNLVGFQTNLTYGEQQRVFSMIPGLQNAKFVRYGLMHKNFYFDAGKVLNRDLSFKANSNIHVGGQITGVEGYVESAASGLAAAIYLDQKLTFGEVKYLPSNTMVGALLDYISAPRSNRLEPMNANWALLGVQKSERLLTAQKSLESLQSYREHLPR